MSPPRFPFIVGCGRSGTTLLRAMLDSHPSFAVPPESPFVAWLGRRAAEEKWDEERLHTALRSVRRLAPWGLPAGTIEGALAGGREFPDIVRALYAAYARLHGKSRYADKTPGNVTHIPELARLFPEACFIHIIRDGRDVALSFVEAPFGPASVAEAAWLWRERVESGRRAGLELGPERYLEIYYEELIADPRGVAVQLCDFIGAPYDGAMLAYHAHSNHILASVGYPEQHGNLTRPPTQGLRDWRREMSRVELAVFEAVAGGTLAACGYERACPPTPAALLWGLAARARWRLRCSSLTRWARRLGRLPAPPGFGTAPKRSRRPA